MNVPAALPILSVITRLEERSAAIVDNRLDRLARLLAHPVSRRSVLGSLLALFGILIRPKSSGRAMLFSPPAGRGWAVPHGTPNPECTSASCDKPVFCSTNPHCVCAAVAEGGGACLPNSTRCDSLALCSRSADCPAGALCLVNTCCNGGQGVCFSPDLQTCPASTGSS